MSRLLKLIYKVNAWTQSKEDSSCKSKMHVRQKEKVGTILKKNKEKGGFTLPDNKIQ